MCFIKRRYNSYPCFADGGLQSLEIGKAGQDFWQKLFFVRKHWFIKALLQKHTLWWNSRREVPSQPASPSAALGAELWASPAKGVIRGCLSPSSPGAAARDLSARGEWGRGQFSRVCFVRPVVCPSPRGSPGLALCSYEANTWNNFGDKGKVV